MVAISVPCRIRLPRPPQWSPKRLRCHRRSAPVPEFRPIVPVIAHFGGSPGLWWTSSAGLGKHSTVTESSPEDGKKGATSGDGASAENKPLPTWNRSRTKRKKSSTLDEEDAFQRGMRKGSKAAKGRLGLVVTASVGAVVALGGVLFVMSQVDESAARQTRILAKASGVVGRGIVVDEDQLPADLSRATPDPMFTSQEAKWEAYENSLTELEAVEDAPALASMLRAAELVRVGDSEAAVAKYDAFMAEAGEGHPLYFLALEGKGLALENTGKLDEALAQFERLAGRKGSFYRDMALWHQGRTLEGLDRVEDARGVYRTYVEEYPPEISSLARDQVRERLQQLDPSALEVTPPAMPGDDAAEAGKAPAPPAGE